MKNLELIVTLIINPYKLFLPTVLSVYIEADLEGNWELSVSFLDTYLLLLKMPPTAG